MKKSSSLLSMTLVVAIAFFAVSPVFAQTQKSDSKTQTEQKLTKEEHVKMLNEKIAALQKKLSALKTEAAAKKKDTAAEYKTMLASVEGKVSALRTKISSFKETAADKVEAFKKATHEDWKSIETEYDKLHHSVYGEVKADVKKETPK